MRSACSALLRHRPCLRTTDETVSVTAIVTANVDHIRLMTGIIPRDVTGIAKTTGTGNGHDETMTGRGIVTETGIVTKTEVETRIATRRRSQQRGEAHSFGSQADPSRLAEQANIARHQPRELQGKRSARLRKPPMLRFSCRPRLARWPRRLHSTPRQTTLSTMPI